MKKVETEFNSSVPIKGNCHEDFQEVAEIFAQNFDKYGEIGSSVCVVIDGETTVDLWAGHKNEQRTDDWNENYYIQGSAYAEMFEERTGNGVNQVVILVVTEDGTVQEFIKEKYDYLDSLTESVTEWRNQNETPNNNNGGVSAHGLSNN